MNNKLYIVVLITAGLLVHFLYYGNPNQVVFDEVWYGRHVNDYIKGTFHFDGHPPLARMTISGFAKLMNYQPNFSFENIGETYPDKQYFILRFLPSLAGAVLPTVVYLIMLELGITPFTSFLGALLLVFDNGLLVQTRFLLMDGFLLLYGFLSLLFYFKYRNTHKKKFLFLTGVFAGCSFAVKWVGLSFFAVPVIFEGLDILKNMFRNGFGYLKNLKTLTTLVALVVVPVIVYFSAVMAYAGILHRSGTGDAFMSAGYQKTLDGNQYQNDPNIEVPNIFSRFWELNKQMYLVNQGLTATHPYSSLWYTWPFMFRPIYYWVSSSVTPPDPGYSRIYFIGNPVVWWSSSVAILYSLLLIGGYLWKKLRRYESRSEYVTPILFILISGYILDLLPYVGIKRIMFLYHYLSAMIFAVMIMAYLLDNYFKQITHKHGKLSVKKDPQKMFLVLVVLAVISFIYFAPLSYGTPLSDKAFHARVWFSSWE